MRFHSDQLEGDLVIYRAKWPGKCALIGLSEQGRGWLPTFGVPVSKGLDENEVAHTGFWGDVCVVRELAFVAKSDDLDVMDREGVLR